MKRIRVFLIYIDAGGGHRAAAMALAEVIRQQQRPWDLELVAVQDLLAPIDFIRKSTGIPFQDVYNLMLRHGWTLGTAQLIPMMHGVIRASHDSQVEALRTYWNSVQPDMVVSLVPHYNRALKEALDTVWPGTPYVTVLTDIADYPPHFWMERLDQWVVCGSARAVGQARSLGIPESRILQTSGMILHPKFYSSIPIDRARERERHGLKPELPTGLVLFGGEGSTEILRIARALNRADLGIQLILVCGKNSAVEAALRAMDKRIPMLVEGFTCEIPYYMELADFFIGKPGPGSISEALSKRLPLIVQRNAWTMAHELYNTHWIEEMGFGIVIGNFRQLAEALRTLLAPGNYSRFRANTSTYSNYAVHEIPEMLAEILAGLQPVTAPGSDPRSGFAARSRPDMRHLA